MAVLQSTVATVLAAAVQAVAVEEVIKVLVSVVAVAEEKTL
jgi:hypothetical protein